MVFSNTTLPLRSERVSNCTCAVPAKAALPMAVLVLSVLTFAAGVTAGATKAAAAAEAADAAEEQAKLDAIATARHRIAANGRDIVVLDALAIALRTNR